MLPRTAYTLNRDFTDRVKQAAAGHWPAILSAIAGIPREFLDGKPHPCPKCREGKDRFRLIDEHAGAVLCNQCFSERNGDGLAAIMWMLGCDFPEAVRQVAQYLGIAPGKSFTMPVTSQKPTATATKTKPTGRTFESPEAAAEVLRCQLDGQSSCWWPYDAADGAAVGAVVRINFADQPKTVRPLRRDPDGWRVGAMATPRPLFNLPAVMRAERVFLAEGEPAASALIELGLIATTVAGGAQAVRHSDLTPLAGREVIIWPDDDTPGSQYAETATQILLTLSPPARVKQIKPEVANSGAGEDAVDWLARRDSFDGEQILTELQSMVDAAEFIELESADDASEKNERPRLQLISSKELAEGDYKSEYLVSGLLVKGQPAIIAGGKKSLKTTLAIDLSLSLGSGAKFLNHFYVPKPVRVGLMSGESGASTIQESARRIAKSKPWFELSAYENCLWSFNVPQLGDPAIEPEMVEFVLQNKLEVLVLDPVYLMLPLGDDAANLFKVGQSLAIFNRLTNETGVTVVLVHHLRKGPAGQNQFEPPELEQISWSGFQEWARQWVLIGRRERYNPENAGHHELWLCGGGSACHSFELALDADEGSKREGADRRWEVQVRKASEARREQAEQHSQLASALKGEREDRRLTAKQERIRNRALDALGKFPNGETGSILAAKGGIANAEFGTVIPDLIAEGLAEPAKIKKGGREYAGYRLKQAAQDGIADNQPPLDVDGMSVGELGENHITPSSPSGSEGRSDVGVGIPLLGGFHSDSDCHPDLDQIANAEFE